jgi:hypothetical protein
MGEPDQIRRGYHLSSPANFNLYRLTAFGPRSRKLFFADRRARWSTHFGGQLTDTQWMAVDAAIGVEWDIRRLERKTAKNDRELAALTNPRRQFRLALADLGVKAPEAKPGSTLAKLMAKDTNARRRSTRHDRGAASLRLLRQAYLARRHAIVAGRSRAASARRNRVGLTETAEGKSPQIFL